MDALISLRLPDHLAKRINFLAKKNGMKRSEFIRRLLERDLAENLSFDRPYTRVADLLGSLHGKAPLDLASKHSDYLRDIFG